MLSNRRILIPLSILVALSLLPAPLLIRGILRWRAIQKILKEDGARERLAIEPRNRTLKPSEHPVRPVNIGYATIDLGSNNPIAITAWADNRLKITNGDFRADFLPPFLPLKRKTPITSKISKGEAKSYPHTYAYLALAETNFLGVEEWNERVHLLSSSKIFFMNSDDFRLYSFTLIFKGLKTIGRNEVQIFDNPDTKGIVWVGEKSDDRSFANIGFISKNAPIGVGLLLKLNPESSRKIEEILDPIISSFRFTCTNGGDTKKITDSISGAGIKLEDSSQ